MRRRPHKGDQEQRPCFHWHRACYRGPAYNRRKRARGTTNHNVLVRRTLKPHRVDYAIEENRECEQRAGLPVGRQRHDDHRHDRHENTKRQRIAGLYAAGRKRTCACARHHRINVGVIPHIDRTSRAGAQRNSQERSCACQPVNAGWRSHQTSRSREDHEHHNARLHKLEIIADGRR